MHRNECCDENALDALDEVRHRSWVNRMREEDDRDRPVTRIVRPWLPTGWLRPAERIERKEEMQ